MNRCTCTYPTEPHEHADNESIRPNDMVHVLGWKRVTSIRPYRGPLTAIVFAIADTVPGGGFSLERGGTTIRACSP